MTIRRWGAQRQKEGSEGRREKMRGDKMIWEKRNRSKGGRREEGNRVTAKLKTDQTQTMNR